MGLKKTNKSVLKHFLWARLKSGVVRHQRTCHLCQVPERPNQVIPPAPLCPIPVLGPFKKVIVDCVGLLPKAKAENQFLATFLCAFMFSRSCLCAKREKKITAMIVTKALMEFFLLFDLPKSGLN